MVLLWLAALVLITCTAAEPGLVLPFKMRKSKGFELTSPQPAITLNKAHVHSLNTHSLQHLLGARQCSVLGLPPQDT